MSKLIVMGLMLALTGCGMTPTQRWMVVGGIVVAGAVAAHEMDNGGRKNNCPQDNCGHMVEIPN